MNDIRVEHTEDTIVKRAISPRGLVRLRDEQRIYEKLQSCVHIPKVIATTNHSITVERIEAESLQDIVGTIYRSNPHAWKEAKPLLNKCIEAETSLLQSGVLYRDLNLQHLLFTDKQAVLIDLEASVVREKDDLFHQNDIRGTWETMAPEEFMIRAKLSDATATYRVAVVAHLLLTGRLPFCRYSDSRARMHAWRKSHPPIVSQQLPKPVRKVFMAALSRQPEHQYKNPERFLKALSTAYKATV
jgi:serine/threonine protein kinase